MKDVKRQGKVFLNKREKWKKRVLSILLVFVTILTLVPSSVYADGTQGEKATVDTGAAEDVDSAGGMEENTSETEKAGISIAWTPEAEEVKTGETGTVRLTAELEYGFAEGTEVQVEISLDAREAAALENVSDARIVKEEQGEGNAKLSFSLDDSRNALDSTLTFHTENDITAPFEIQITKDDIKVTATKNGNPIEAEVEKQGGTMKVAASFGWETAVTAKSEFVQWDGEKGTNGCFSWNMSSQNRAETGTILTKEQEVVFALTLPEGMEFPEGTYQVREEKGENKTILVGKMPVVGGLPEELEVAEVKRADVRTLALTLRRENTNGQEELSDLVTELTLFGGALEAEETFQPAQDTEITLVMKAEAVSLAGESYTSVKELTVSLPVVAEERTEEDGEAKTEGTQKRDREKTLAEERDGAFQIPDGATVSIQDYAQAITRQIYWSDNNDEADIRPEAGGYPEAALHFTVKAEDGTAVGTGILSESNMKELGLASMPIVDVVDRGGSHYEYAVTAGRLPSKITVTDIYGTPVSYTVEWKAVPEEVDGYALAVVTEENKDNYPSISDREDPEGWYYMLETDFSFKIDLHCGEVEADTQKIQDRLMEQFALNLSYGSKNETYDLDAIGKDNFAVEKIEGTDNDTLWEGTISGLWKYNLDGSLIYATVSEEDKDGRLDVPGSVILEEGDYFAISYDNSAASNYGAVKDCIHDGGTLDLTLAGETEYQAEKQWLDEEDSQRPAGELQLWRYRKGASYTTAAAVRDTDNNILTLDLNGNTEQKITFSDLPKYDAEGYEYIYVVREYLDGSTAEGGTADSYTQVFGKVTENEDGTFTVSDIGEDGTAYKDRPSGNTYLYDGGTLSNRITGTVSAEAVKIWKASAFQAEFEDVSVELTLMCRPAGEEDMSWIEAQKDGKPVKEVMEGFTAETLATTSVDAFMPEYDSLGRKLEYQWIETGVYQGNGGENLLENERFTLEQDGREILYQSEQKMTVTEEGQSQTVITNSIANTIDYEVEKIWENMDPGESVQFSLYRILSGEALTEDSKPVATFTLDGKADPDKVLVNETEKIYCQEMEPWKAEVTGLPEYDEDGREYEYILLENSGGTEYTPTYTTTRDPETRDYYTEVVNAPGEGNRITVRKDWIDDSDILHRETVAIGIYVRKTNERISGVTLEGDVWQAQAGIGQYEVDDVYILEETVGGEKIPLRETEKDEDQYEPECPVFYTADAETCTEIRYETDHHRYEATYHEAIEIAGETIYSVTNRRLGNVDLTVTKEWVDGDGERREEIQTELEELKEESHGGLSLNLRLTFADSVDSEGSGYKIDYENDYVTIGNRDDQVPIMRPVKEEGGLTGDDREKGSAIVPIELSEDSFTCYFWNLPKYDQNGSVVRYSVEEVWLNEEGQEVTLEEMSQKYPDLYALVAEYSSGYQETFVTSDLHDVDTQTVTVTNKLTGTKEVRWHKQWNDMYNYDSGLRPDIYLDIYTVKREKGDGGVPEKKIELYRANYKWEYSEDASDSGESSEDGTYDKQRHWHAVLSGLPKYDAYGYEIIYYAVEHTLVNASDFDYTDTVYSIERSGNLEKIGTVNQLTDPTALDDGDAIAIPDEELDPFAEQTYALREEGTFTNNLSGTASVTGRKLWENLPSGYPREDMPDIRFRLEQYVAVNPWNQDQDDNDDGLVLIDDECAVLTVTDWTSVYKNGSYTFQIDYEGENVMEVEEETGEVSFGPANESAAELPRYDALGSLYIYRLVEDKIIWDEDITDPDLDIDDVYTKEDGSNTYLVSNAYEGKKGALSYQKYLYLPTDENGTVESFPAVLFRLVRTYTKGADEDGNKIQSDPEVAETITWTSAQVKEAVEKEGEDFDGLIQHTFTIEDQEIYAPNGSEYQYYICEVKTYLNDYNTWVKADDIKEAELALTMKEKPSEPELQEGEKRIPVAIKLTQNQADGKGATEENLPICATFINQRTEDPAAVTLQGEKIWEDYSNAFETRPEDVELKVFRLAISQPGQGNQIPEQEVPATEYEITWTKEEGDTWTYEIQGAQGSGELERYAPNGRPWQYIVREYLEDGSVYQVTPVDGSGTAAGQVTEKNPDGTTEGTSWMNPLTNSMETAAVFRKEWQDSDGNEITEDYLGNKIEIDFKLQVAEETIGTDGSGNIIGKWSDASEYFKKNLTSEDYGKIFGSGETPYQFTQTLQGRVTDSIWGKGGRFQDLPRSILKKDETTRTNLLYRVVESELRYGSQAINVGVIDSDDNRTYTYEFGESLFSPAYELGDSNNAGTQTHINRIGSTSFTVTKEWQGDRDNIYGTRPDTESVGDDWETIFVIQRTTTPRVEKNWKNVTDGVGQALIVYVTGANADESASVTVSGLPQQNENGETYYYRARELQPAEDRYIDGEVTDEDIVAEDGTYHDAYTASYTDDLEHGTGTTAVNTLKSTKIYAVKNWYGKENTSVTLELQYLTENGQWTSFPTAASVTLDGTTDPDSSTPWYEYESWQAVWEDVPSVYPGSALTEGGRTQYRVVENTPDGYIQISSDTQTKEEGGQEYTEWVFTNVASTSLTVTKAWYEIAAADQQAVTVELWRTTGTIGDSVSEPVKDADGDVQTLTLTAGNQWTGTFSDLPKYDADGQPYTYYAAETKIGDEPAEDSGYRIVYTYGGSAADGFTASIANIGRMEVTGTKTWVDNGNAYGTRPDTLELKLYRSTTGADGSWAEVSAQTLAEEGAELIWSNTDTDVWTYRYRNLPAADDDGNPYQYRVEEVTPETVTEEDTYKGTSETTADGANFTNTLTGTVDIPVSKIWQDGSDADGERPTEVTLILYADGVEKERITLTADNADAGKDRWSYTFTGLDKYDSTGKQITYTVGEAAVPDGYEASADQGSYTVTNVLLTSLSVRKVWGGVPEEDQEDVTVALYRSIEGQEEEAVTDGQGNVLTLTLTAQGNWTGTFTDIPRFDENGNRYSYTVREISIGGRPAEESDYIIHIGKDKNGAVVSNIAKTFLTGVKIWRDEQNAYGTRPETLKLTLWRQIEGGEKEQAEATPVWDNTDSDTWTYTFENLPVTDDEGNPYTYWVTEEVPEEYELTQQEGNRFVNTLKDTIDISVEKLWTDQNNMRGIRPSSIEVPLYADGQEVERAELSRENGWSRTFPELEEYDETGRRIQYEVKETQVPDGYKVSYSGGTQEGFIIENTREDLAGGSLAKTGDGANLAGYAGLMLISGTVFAVTVTGKKRKKKGNR